MAFCIMNVDKQKRHAVFGLQCEANRKPNDRREFDNSDINQERTQDNIFLRECEHWNATITREINEAGCRERKDSVVMITGVYTASPDWFETHTKEQWMQYFKECLDFHDKTYGRAFNAVIHLDETTPHMQVASVPLIESEKGVRLSAKDLMGGKTDYVRRQDQFYEQVGKQFSLERGIHMDAAERKKHTTKREYQIAMQEQKLQEQQQRSDLIVHEAEQTWLKLQNANRQLDSTVAKVDALTDAVKKRLKVPSLKNRKDTVVVDRAAYESTLDALQEIRTVTKRLTEQAAASAADREEAARLRDAAQRALSEETTRISNLAQLMAQDIAANSIEDQKAARDMKRRYSILYTKELQHIKDAAQELIDDVLQDSDCNMDYVDRMRGYLSQWTVTDVDGHEINALDDFDNQETARERSIRRQIDEWER